MAYIHVTPPTALDEMVFEELPDGSIIQHNDVFLYTDPRFLNKHDTATQLALQDAMHTTGTKVAVGDKDMLLTTTPSRYAQSFTEQENYQRALTGYAKKLQQRAADSYRMFNMTDSTNSDKENDDKSSKYE